MRATFAPFSPSIRTTARPTPPLAPVTTTTLSFSTSVVLSSGGARSKAEAALPPYGEDDVHDGDHDDHGQDGGHDGRLGHQRERAEGECQEDRERGQADVDDIARRRG